MIGPARSWRERSCTRSQSLVCSPDGRADDRYDILSAVALPGDLRRIDLMPMRMRLWVGPRDGSPAITRLALGGLLLALVLARIGNLPFDIPMPTHAFGWVEPTCGLTRGSTALVRGDPTLAWRFNPASYLVLATGLLVVVRAAFGLVTGRWVNVAGRIRFPGWVLLVAVLVVLEIHQQGNATFVMTARL
jgi:hypothetical protein